MFLKFLILLVFIFVALVSFGQKNKKSKIAPPGTVQINDTLFVDKTEIANIHWREYLHYLEKFNPASIGKALPDTTVWGADTVFKYDSVNNIPIKIYTPDPLTEYYFRHPGFNDFPVVGISYEQAVAFCDWRSDRVNELYSKMPESKRPFEKVVYRLMTQKEWEVIAAGKLSVDRYPYGFDSTYKKWKKKYYKAFNCKFPNDTLIYYHWGGIAYYTLNTWSYYPNSSGTYNMIGNVAEMVSEKGIAKGGSFDHILEECKIINNQYYSRPERWLGFRCVAVVEK